MNATIGDPQAVGTIADDDPPGLAISDSVVAEPHSGVTAAVFTVTLFPPTSGTTTVSYAITDGSASAPADYTATAGTLTFLGGQTSQALTVPVKADATAETPETFFVDLMGSSGPPIARSRGTATIVESASTPFHPAGCSILGPMVRARRSRRGTRGQ